LKLTAAVPACQPLTYIRANISSSLIKSTDELTLKNNE
jgi:hypothetical protein